MQLIHKNVMVAGLGKTGLALIKALYELGANIYVYDDKAEGELSSKNREFLKNVNAVCFLNVLPSEETLRTQEMLILSPGIPLTHELPKKAKATGIRIIGELEFAYLITAGKFVAVTGTNGKTTTTSLVGLIFKNAGLDARIVGNIGIPAVEEALKAKADTWLITEVSSFQLETVSEFKPVISAILNLTPDHLNRHGTMENYGNIKANIFRMQDGSDFYIANADDEASFKLSAQCKNARVIPFTAKKKLKFGVFVEKGIIMIAADEKIAICDKNDLKIKGEHNLENALAACGIAYFAGISPEVIAKSLKEFEGVEHRLEYVETINGVRFVNDSKGTNPDSSIKAVYAMEKNIVLIAGGSNKNSDYTDFAKTFEGRVKHLIVQGETANAIAKAAKNAGFTSIVFSEGMGQSVEKAFELAENGDVVLLSPACASFDFYANFEKRGEDFKQKVYELKEKIQRQEG